MWRLFFAVVVFVPIIFAQSGVSETEPGQQYEFLGRPHYGSSRDCKHKRLNQCEHDYDSLQRQLDVVYVELTPLANERNAVGSEYVKLLQEYQILDFQVKNPGKPAPSPRPIMHMRPPAIRITLSPMTVNGHRCLSKCQRAIAEGQEHLHKEQERIKVLLVDIPKSRTTNAQLQAKVNELGRQLRQRP